MEKPRGFKVIQSLDNFSLKMNLVYTNNIFPVPILVLGEVSNELE